MMMTNLEVKELSYCYKVLLPERGSIKKKTRKKRKTRKRKKLEKKEKN